MVGTEFHRGSEVERAFGGSSWQTVVHRELCAILESRARPFPCIFGAAALKADQLRFAFHDTLAAPWLAAVLASYLKVARDIGPYTSLVTFARPGPVSGLEGYRKRMWALLRDVAELDTQPWPAAVDSRLDHPTWEFSFAGEPIFVVCNTPAHVLRQSRHASTFMITFQPRFVFDGVLDGRAKGDRAVAAVRQRLAAYDMVPASPSLGRYGEADVREHEQYFLSDDNERPRCPFVTLRGDDWQPTGKSEAAA
jgi:uncharacterized protein